MNRLDQRPYFAFIWSQRPCSSMEQQTISRSCCCRTRRMESKSMNLPSSSQPLDSSPQSRRTEEVARWRWSPRLWRLRRWELSHQRMLMSASPRMGDTTGMQHCRSRPRYHPCKGEREVRPSRRNWSSWCLSRVRPGVQKSHPHASLVLLLRRPPCARESSCLLARLPPWRDVAAERHAPGMPKTFQ